MKKVSGVQELGGLYGGKSWSSHQQDRVYNPDGICPCMATTKGDVIPKILIDMKKEEKQKVIEQVESMLGDKKDDVNVILQDNGTIRPRKINKRLPVQKLIIQNEENSAETLTTIHEPKVYGKSTKYRIRKLTEKECFRLMDVEDKDSEKIMGIISRTQCYKLAGNSIVVACLYHIFRKMFVEKDNESNDGQLSLF